MSQRRIQLTILCEDQQQEVFARYFLIKRGFKPEKIRSRICSKGSQAAEQYVRVEYPKEVKSYRTKAKKSLKGLVVLIDADTKSPNQILQNLNNALIDSSQERRQPNEAIAIFIPKRNIETWIHYLQGESVDEETEFSKFTKNESACKTCVEKLANQCSQGDLDPQAPLSLTTACGELQRILRLRD